MGQCFGTVGVVLDAISGKKLVECDDVVGLGHDSAALDMARELAARLGYRLWAGAQIRMRAKAFTGEGERTHRVWVDADSTVRVWDSVAGHYTVCHSLSARDEARARRLARRAA